MNTDKEMTTTPEERKPSAWLVTGGRIFKDRVFISEAGAIKSSQERDDGASVEPLYLDDQLPPAPVAEDLSSEPVAWMHDQDGRVDVIHKDVKKFLADWDATKYGTGDGFHRPLATVAHYTIPLYTHPQPAVDVDALAEFLEVSDFFGFSPAVARDLAMQICNWIEEQQR